VKKLSITDLDLSGRRVFMRVDFNVPMSGGEISDDSRIRSAFESIEYVLGKGGRLILASHMGRPRGQSSPGLSLGPVALRLGELLGRPVGFAPDCVGPEVEAIVERVEEGAVLLLENLRFHPEEETNESEFAAGLAALCDVYVNDAFGAAHRAHASTVGIVSHLERAAAGFLMGRELEALGRALDHPTHPYISVIGGAKISGKIELIQKILDIADDILIGGAMAYTFLRAQGVATGKSLVEEDRVGLAQDLLESAEQKGRRILLPEDHVVARGLDSDDVRTVGVGETAPEEMGLDIGRRTIERYCAVIGVAKTVVWNGPMGVFENANFAEGTFAVGRAVADSDAFSIVGGGDSAAAVHASGLVGAISHVSTGGGAALEFLSGRPLPGVDVLTDR